MHKDGWGASLQGDRRDLADWVYCLSNSFDPRIEHHGTEVILRSASFASVKSAVELRDSALTVIDVLNGAMAIDQQTRRVEFGGAVEFSGGKLLHHVKLAKGTSELRIKVRGVAQAIDANGNVIIQPPQPSRVQQL